MTLSDDAKVLLRFLAEAGDGSDRGRLNFLVSNLCTALGWDEGRASDAVQILEDAQLVDVMHLLGGNDGVELNARGRAAARP